MMFGFGEMIPRFMALKANKRTVHTMQIFVTTCAFACVHMKYTFTRISICFMFNTWYWRQIERALSYIAIVHLLRISKVSWLDLL